MLTGVFLTAYFCTSHLQISKIQASLCSLAGWFDSYLGKPKDRDLKFCFLAILDLRPSLEVIKLELILKLRIKRNDTGPQAANHCALFWVWDCTQIL